MAKGLLYTREYKINDDISIKIPSVGEILEHEADYYRAISLIVATPYDMMVQLDDNGIDFTKINDWDLFCLLFGELKKIDLSMIFGDLKLCDFYTAVNKQNGNVVLRNPKNGVVIDRGVHDRICRFLRKILCIQKNNKKPANKEAKDYLLDRMRRKMKRRGGGTDNSQIENYIVALVNTSEFPYDYESVLDLTIYQFYASLGQIVKKIRYDNLMIGCYAGTVNMKELDQKELNWITNE